MTYKGYKELKKYIEQTSKASFTKFVENNVLNLANWSFQESINTSPALNGFWFEKYRQVYMEVNGNAKGLRRPKNFNLLIWNDILARINRRRKVVDRCSEAALDVTAAVAESSTAQITQSLNHRNLTTNHNLAESRDNEEASEEERSETGDSIETAYTADNEVQNSDLNNYAVKKFLGTFNESDKTAIRQKLTKGDSIEQRITNHIIELLCQDHLTPIEQETLKLLLSNIINTLDESIYTAMESIFTLRQLGFLCEQDTPESEEGYGLDLPSLAMLDELIANCNDIDSFLRQILVEKIGLIDKKERNSDCFRMLCILDTIGQSFDMPIDDNASEMTYYRRFAVLLDYVFGGSDINMTDGEVVAEATRMAMGQNDYDTSNLFGRKIDLLLKIKDTTVELASNEWKSNRTKHLQLKQQSKNLRSNCAILNKLYIESGTIINMIMAADVVGSTGYIYKLQLKSGVYVTTVVEAIFLPSTLDELVIFKKTIKALFFWKDFLVNQAKIMKQILLMSRLDAIVRPSSSLRKATTTDIPSPPLIFFTPKNKRTQKRPIHLMN